MTKSRLTQIILFLLLCLMTYFARAETGVTSDTVTFGMSAPFSGPNGAYGIEMRDAINAFFAQVNREGGIHGHQLKLIARDDGYETERTVANTRTLLEQDRVFALMAYYGSSPTAAALPYLSSAKTPLIGTISGAEALRKPANPYLFNLRASYEDETSAIVGHLISMGLSRIAVLYQNDGFGQSGLAGATAVLRKHKLEPVALASVERNSVDVAAAVETIVKAKPQAVVMVMLYKPTAAFVRGVKAAGWFPQFATLSPVGADLLVSELGADARGIGISQVMPYPWNNTIPVVKEYQNLMNGARGKAGYTYYGLEGYINAKLVVEALKKAGPTLTREKLIAILDGMREFNLGGYSVDYSSNSHNGSSMVELTIIGQGGRVLR